MKKILFNITSAILMTSIIVSSCTKDFTNTNTDPNNSSQAVPEQFLAPALVNTMAYNMLRNRNFNNELMQVTVDLGDGDGKVFRYEIRASLSDYLYNGWYAQLSNFKEMYKYAADSLTLNNSYKGISMICQSWIYSLLTDTYGDVPYFESNKAKPDDGGIVEPVFDKQKDIYFDIFKKLEEANTLLSPSTPTAIEPLSDPVYNGDVKKWRKFGNSLYLRLLLRLSGKAEVADTCIKKITEIAQTKTSSYPIIASNEESAILKWTGVPPYTSPLMTVREQDFRQPAIGSFFIDNLVDWGDPRIDVTLGTNGINRWRIAPVAGVFGGVPSGYKPGDNPVKRSYFYSTNQTVNGSTAPTLMNEPLAGMILNFAEVKFMLAEAAAKGWITSSAQTHYNDGAYAAIRLWLPTWTGVIATFLNDADIAWDNNETLDQKMERIHKLKYYALFLNDLQQWFEYRRTGHPKLPQGTGLRNDGIMPARMVYPVYVQSTNPTNYRLAVDAQGPDVISTKVWWQRP